MWTEPLEYGRLSWREVRRAVTKGTAEKGAELFEAAVSEVASFVDDLRAHPIPTRRDRHDA
jgi:hypothetical protein